MAALSNTQTGSDNTGVGGLVLLFSTGNNNVAVGYNAGVDIDPEMATS
jgi:hypothetical protein